MWWLWSLVVHVKNLLPPCMNIWAEKEAQKIPQRTEVEPAHLFFLQGFVGKKHPVSSRAQAGSTMFEKETAHKLKLFCKESLNIDRNLMRSFLWCQIADLGVTFKMLQQEKQEPWQSLSHLLKCGEAGAGLMDTSSTVNRAAGVWGIKHKGMMTRVFCNKGNNRHYLSNNKISGVP